MNRNKESEKKVTQEGKDHEKIDEFNYLENKIICNGNNRRVDKGVM